MIAATLVLRLSQGIVSKWGYPALLGGNFVAGLGRHMCRWESLGVGKWLGSKTVVCFTQTNSSVRASSPPPCLVLPALACENGCGAQECKFI